LGNVIDPTAVVKEYGADTLRVYEMFMAPFEQTVAWDTKSIVGTERFLERVWKLQSRIKQGANDTDEALSVLHKTIKKVGEDIENFKFNTAISAMMICLNRAEEEPAISKEWYTDFIKLLAPFAPHMTEELWHAMGEESSIHAALWPAYDDSRLVEAKVTIAIQVGGKLRGTMDLARDADEQTVLEEAKKLESYRKYVGENEPKKVIFVPNKLINIVI
jgi:leucyl-tRNA synthetase